MIRRMISLAAAFILSTQLWAIVNINTASQQELEALHSIGPVKAQAIIEYRQKNGPFKNIEEVTQVKGVGDATLGHIRKDISVGASGLADLFRTKTQPANDGRMAQTTVKKTGTYEGSRQAVPIKSAPATQAAAKTTEPAGKQTTPVAILVPQEQRGMKQKNSGHMMVRNTSTEPVDTYNGTARTSKEFKLDRKAEKKAADRSRKAARGMKENYKDASVSATGISAPTKHNKYPSKKSLDQAAQPF